ncbi:MAG: glycosyltransferase family 2 protein [Leptolyngbyaceae cyanobacterium CAN_BIN12]|nr:glycosyltransferase family 2 protein [Leptolyngbyaceae cyanobacterium CAN_BIN12]
MPENSWRESDSFNDLPPISALLADLSDLVEPDEDPDPHIYGTGNRRRRAAIALMTIWSGTIALHFVAWSYWFVAGLTTLVGIHAVRILFARPLPPAKPLDTIDPACLPVVSVLVAAKNEEAVIERLVKTLCNLDYPATQYELWVIDDNSTDRTSALLKQLAQQYEQLRVFHRPVGSAGGKSGALNQVLPLTRGEIIAVFDADAQVTPDLFRRVLPLFDRAELGAVQVRKQIANVSGNWWVQGQIAEMALDSFWQDQRIAIGGIGELRGNGQFVRREALDRCGGWNEETITDDLDLTFRLHLDNWDIDFTTYPAVKEEGVTDAIALWHQRSRWAEGGYQRYLDYWQPLLRTRMGIRKTVDMAVFWILQYALPSATVPDMLMAILRHQPLLFAPLAGLSVLMSLMGMTFGLRRIRRSTRSLSTPPTETNASTLPSLILLRAIYGTLYMLHWLPVVASTTARISIRPKRLKWVKTRHYGQDEVA